MVVTRTLNPLPFEHLEPKRFEDLVRQLVYDFRSWRALEATGRSGADEGFDARGIEIGPPQPSEDVENDDGGEALANLTNDRVWLIQCKREKSIGPTKIVNQLSSIPQESVDGLYGLIFVAACDLSKATRDACRNWCRERGIQEIQVWGRGEIEDQLFQPKNDNLLFGFFGISLQIRRQNAATKIRRNIALKRRIRKVQEDRRWPGAPIVFRDPSEERYPDIKLEDWDRGQYLWRPAWSRGSGVHGLRVILRQHYAYFDNKTGEWDFATAFNQIYPMEARGMWPPPASLGESDAIVDAWRSMPRQYQVHFRLVGTLPYDEIIEIDQEPDDFCELPTLFTSFRPRRYGEGFEPPYRDRVDIELEGSAGHWNPPWHPERHVLVFPESMRNKRWEEDWSALNGFALSTRRIELPVDPEIEASRQATEETPEGSAE